MDLIKNPMGQFLMPQPQPDGRGLEWEGIVPMTTRSERRPRPSGKSPSKRIHVLNQATRGIDPRDGVTPMRDFKGYALCGAGKPSGEYPYGSTEILDPKTKKYQRGISITCYRCLKLLTLNQGNDLYFRQFSPTDRAGIELRRSHIMLPEGRQGLYVADIKRPAEAPADAPMDPKESGWVIGPPIARTQSRLKAEITDKETGQRPAVNEFFGFEMPELKIGDYVDEKGRMGQVTALHTEGTADVQFEDLDYPIRRQIRNLRVVQLNPKRGGVLYEVYDPTRAQFNAQVQAIYESLVKKHQKKKSTAAFKSRGKRIDSRMSKATVRQLLNQAFQIATGVGQKHGYLKKGTNVATAKGRSRSAARQDDYQHLMDNIVDYETTLAMSRQEPYRVVEMKQGKQTRYYIMPTMRYRLSAQVAIDDVKKMNKESQGKLERQKGIEKARQQLTKQLEEESKKPKRLRNPKKPKVRLQDEYSRAKTGRTPIQDLTTATIVPYQVPLYDPSNVGEEGGLIDESLGPIGYYWDYILVGPAYLFQGRRSIAKSALSREQTAAMMQGIRNTNLGANSFRMREELQEDYANPTIGQLILDRWSRKILDQHGPITNDERRAMEAIVRANEFAWEQRKKGRDNYNSLPNYFLAFAFFAQSIDPDVVVDKGVMLRRDLVERFDKAWMGLYDPTRTLKTEDWGKQLPSSVVGSRFEIGYVPDKLRIQEFREAPIADWLVFYIPDFESYYDPDNMEEVVETVTFFGIELSQVVMRPKKRKRLTRETTQMAYYEPSYFKAQEVDAALDRIKEVQKLSKGKLKTRMESGAITPEELFSLTVIQTAKVLRFLIASKALLGRDNFQIGDVLTNPITQSAWTYCTNQGLSENFILSPEQRARFKGKK